MKTNEIKKVEKEIDVNYMPFIIKDDEGNKSIEHAHIESYRLLDQSFELWNTTPDDILKTIDSSFELHVRDSNYELFKNNIGFTISYIIYNTLRLIYHDMPDEYINNIVSLTKECKGELDSIMYNVLEMSYAKNYSTVKKYIGFITNQSANYLIKYQNVLIENEYDLKLVTELISSLSEILHTSIIEFILSNLDSYIGANSFGRKGLKDVKDK